MSSLEQYHNHRGPSQPKTRNRHHAMQSSSQGFARSSSASVLLCFRFNKKSPSKGIKFLQTEGLLGDSVTEVAQFLHTDDKLDKVGEYFISGNHSMPLAPL